MKELSMNDDFNSNVRVALLGLVIWNIFWIAMLTNYPNWALCRNFFCRSGYPARDGPICF